MFVLKLCAFPSRLMAEIIRNRNGHTRSVKFPHFGIFSVAAGLLRDKWNLMNQSKTGGELKHAILGLVYMEVGEVTRFSRGRKIKRVYMQSNNPGALGWGF